MLKQDESALSMSTLTSLFSGSSTDKTRQTFHTSVFCISHCSFCCITMRNHLISDWAMHSTSNMQTSPFSDSIRHSFWLLNTGRAANSQPCKCCAEQIPIVRHLSLGEITARPFSLSAAIRQSERLKNMSHSVRHKLYRGLCNIEPI